MPPPASLVSYYTYAIPGKLLVTDLTFDVPLDHNDPTSRRIRLFGRAVTVNSQSLAVANGVPRDRKPWLAYLEGGPGFGNRQPQESPLVRENLHHQYRILLLDYRGTGLSTPVAASTVPGETAAEQARYLRHFRQDNIVRDLEAVRQCLTEDDPVHLKAWSIFGQSFGGFVSLTYLSFYPDGLREVFLTGALAPVGATPVEVYKATFRKVEERNAAYYRKFPGDIESVRSIVEYIQTRGRIPLPAGGFLTAERFLTLGIAFGGHEGFTSVHALIVRMKMEIDTLGHLTRATLTSLELDTPFDSNPIYAILHEAIYCDGPGVSSSWAALSAGRASGCMSWLHDDYGGPADPLCFSGEMIFPFHFETYPELIALRDAAHELASYADWPALYDQGQLARNTVPVYAASYVDDMYVDFNLARRTAAMVKGIKVFETNALYHNAVRAKTSEVIGALMKLKDDTMD